MHPLDQFCNFFAGTNDRYILDGIVQGRHPGIALCDGELRREIGAEHFRKALCGAVCFVFVRLFCKIKHRLLVFLKGVSQMPKHSSIALKHDCIGIVRDFFKLQGIGCGFYGELNIFSCIVRSKDFFNPLSVFWDIHIGERRRLTENTKHRQSSFPCHRTECRRILTGV